MSGESSKQAGGQGDTLMEHLREPGRRRESLIQIERAVKAGWEIPDQWAAALPKVAAQIASDPDATRRDRLRALQVLQAMRRDNVEAAKALDHIERLDGAGPTERVAVIAEEPDPEAIEQWRRRHMGVRDGD